MIDLALRTVALTAVGLAFGLAHHWVRFGAPFATYEVPAEKACEMGDDAAGPLLLTPAQASELCARHDIVVLDVRPPDQFAAGHVANAVHLPCKAAELRTETADRLGDATTILVYGQSTSEARQVAQSLRGLRYEDVRVIAGGYSAWESAGLACSSGPCDDCPQVAP